MSSPEKKRKKKKTTSTNNPSPESTPIASLPDDLLLSIFARLSRLYYPSLSLVSKTFRSLLASPELYKTRSFLGRTESCFYMCLVFPSEPNRRWFTLCRKPNRTSTKKKKSNGHVMAAIPIPHSPPGQWLGLVAVGSDIYNIGGGSIYEEYSSSVSILDCRSHTWREGPSMLVKRNCPAANVFDGKIYIAGGCEDNSSSNWMEVFDIKTQTWKPVMNPIAERCESIICKSAVIDEAICVFGHKGVAYNPKEDRWEAIAELNYLDLGWIWFTYSVIDKVLFCYSNLDGMKWYDSKIGNWKMLKGLKGLPKFADHCRVKLADYGAKMAVLWDKYLPSSGYQNKTIWCAVIALERRNTQEMWGKVECLDAVLTVPKSYEFVGALSATL
ncbi:F-box/kelch-repeat protein [Cardamine amara subsp. amara]|uniref:F-box/kelch-repeat protein n=1 Tax=Cardamine amara subsp. amara TaxID=228776 RepID=A0ABD1BNC2_CARAN